MTRRKQATYQQVVLGEEHAAKEACQNFKRTLQFKALSRVGEGEVQKGRRSHIAKHDEEHAAKKIATPKTHTHCKSKIHLEKSLVVLHM